MIERNATARDGTPVKNRYVWKTKGIEPTGNTPVGFVPEQNPTAGMPVITHTTPVADVQSLSDWSGAMAAAVRASENRAAQTFLPLAQSCR
jgi:hypothetical protein